MPDGSRTAYSCPSGTQFLESDLQGMNSMTYDATSQTQDYDYKEGNGTCEKPYRSDQIVINGGTKEGPSTYENLNGPTGTWNDKYTCSEDARVRSGSKWEPDSYTTHGESSAYGDCSDRGGECMGVDGDSWCYCTATDKLRKSGEYVSSEGTYFIHQNKDNTHTLKVYKPCNTVGSNT